MKELCNQMTGEELRKDKYSTLNERLLEHLSSFQKNRIELNGENTDIIFKRVFVEPPTLPAKVEQNRHEIAVQKTAKAAEEYRQLTQLKIKETENKLEELEAEKRRRVEKIRNEEKIEGEEAKSRQQKIKAESAASEIRTLADANSYAAYKQAQDKQSLIEAETKAMLNAPPEYLKKIQLESFGCQNKVYWGNDLPDFYIPEKGLNM